MNLVVRVKFVYARSGNSVSEEYYLSSIEALNSLVAYFNDKVLDGMFSVWNLVYVHEKY